MAIRFTRQNIAAFHPRRAGIGYRQINQDEDIEEPDEASQTGVVHLDYGRKGLKGSPDLAIKILEKIDNADLFVGDVTPVGKGPPYRNDEGFNSDGKLLMNPNVAIELGYALKALSVCPMRC